MARSTWSEQRQQVALIARATFGGLLQSDLMPAGMQAQAVIWAAAFLATPAILPCAQDLAKYSFLRRFHPQLVESALWSDKGLFLLLSAGAIGIVAVVMWDTLFPSRRDVFTLGPLPVATHVQSAGRLGGLFTLFAVFVAALNAIPGVLFPLVSGGGLLTSFRSLIGHVVATLAADAFVFFGLTSVQGLLIVVTSRRAAERLAPMIQTAAVLTLLLGLLFFTPLRDATTHALARGSLADPLLRWCPLAWFIGLYETISGTSRPIMGWLALRGVLAGAIPLSVTIALYVLAFRRLCARAIETPARSTSSGLVTVIASVIRVVFVRHPVEQAICAFTLRVLTRSRRHRMLLSIYLGGALALIGAGLLPDILNGQTGRFLHPTVATLAAPLILSAALAVGFRTLVAIPVDLPARWMFRSLAISPLRAGAGVHKAALIVVVVPVVMMAWLSGIALWDTATAWRHALFCASLSIFLTELLLVSYRGVPFAREYVPGASRFHVLWPLYLSAFIAYTFTAAALEHEILASGGLKPVVLTFLILAGAFAATRLWRASRETIVSFEVELPDETFAGFNLSEGLAAQAVAQHGRHT
jgi:hypothetical protein